MDLDLVRVPPYGVVLLIDALDHFWIWSSGMPLLRHHHSGMQSPPTLLVFLWAQRFMACCSTCFFRLSCPASAVFQKVSCSSAVSSLNSSIGQ